MKNWDNIIVIERKGNFKVREKQEKLKEKRCDMKRVRYQKTSMLTKAGNIAQSSME